MIDFRGSRHRSLLTARGLCRVVVGDGWSIVAAPIGVRAS
jgi:hypothetical protein